jgi:hypothetical protein
MSQETDLQPSEAEQTPNQKNQMKSMPTYIIVTILKTKGKEEILKEARESDGKCL